MIAQIFFLFDRFCHHFFRANNQPEAISPISFAFKCTFSRIDFGISTVPSFPMAVDADRIKSMVGICVKVSRGL